MMGYFTYFDVKASEKQREIFEQLIEENVRDFGDMFDYDGDSYDCYKWYDHEADMKEISLMFPDVLFTVKGGGEEAGDLWKKHFKNGKMQRCPAVITFEAYDEAKLE